MGIILGTQPIGDGGVNKGGDDDREPVGAPAYTGQGGS